MKGRWKQTVSSSVSYVFCFSLTVCRRTERETRWYETVMYFSQWGKSEAPNPTVLQRYSSRTPAVLQLLFWNIGSLAFPPLTFLL